MRYSKLILVLLAFAGVSMAADPFVGTWKLNSAKTKYKTGMPPKEPAARRFPTMCSGRSGLRQAVISFTEGFPRQPPSMPGSHCLRPKKNSDAVNWSYFVLIQVAVRGKTMKSTIHPSRIFLSRSWIGQCRRPLSRYVCSYSVSSPQCSRSSSSILARRESSRNPFQRSRKQGVPLLNERVSQ
jgi:hypothetical protein